MKKYKINSGLLLTRVRQEKPLVHHLTNWVTIYDCANAVKVLGASPVMAHAQEEVAQMASLASSLVLNIGTLTVEFVSAMKLAAKGANKKGIPVILDACGAGATKLRDEKCFELLDQVRIDIIKGNASEIARLSGGNVRTKGVDAVSVSGDLRKIAKYLAIKRKAVVVVTGKDDIVTDGKRVFAISNGSPLMGKIVGTGCMSSSIIGAFIGVESDLAVASATALSVFGIAAEFAARDSKGLGSFKERLFDFLGKITPETVNRMQKIKAL
jgi:hydroxyethylthiazole kinase